MDVLTKAAWDKLAPVVTEPDDEAVFKLLLPYFNKNSLLLASVAQLDGEVVCDFANDCDRLRLTMTELRQAADALRSGQRLDWSTYQRLK